MNNHMNQKGFINIIFVLIAVVILGVAGYFILIKKQNPLARSAESECKIIGGNWVQCFNYGPCCSKQFSDGGKQCLGGSDCSSGICKIGTANLIDPPPQENSQDNYVGTCRKTFLGSPFDISNPEPGEASLQNGKIFKDRRNEPGVIY